MLPLACRTEGYYHDARNAIAELVKVGDFEGAREATQKLDDPFWRATILAEELAKVTHDSRDLQAAHEAARATGVSWWRSAALLVVVDAFVTVRDFASARAIVAGEEFYDSFWRAAARKRIAQAQRR